MTEAKSPREIADEIAGGTPVGRSYCQRCQSYDHECGCTPDMDAVIRADLAERVLQALLSYAAERERLVRDQVLEEAAGIADMYAETNLEAAGDSVLHDPVLSGEGFTPENVAKSESLITDGCIHSSMYHAANNIAAAIRRLSSRPATEGKGDD